MLSNLVSIELIALELFICYKIRRYKHRWNLDLKILLNKKILSCKETIVIKDDKILGYDLPQYPKISCINTKRQL